MNKFFDKVLSFVNQLAADHYKRGDSNIETTKAGTTATKESSNVVDINSRTRKEKAGQGMTDYTGGTGL
jgi:hypothetical protein